MDTVPQPTGHESGTAKLAFPSLSPPTSKHHDRKNFRVATIIDFFICLEACYQVTSKNANLLVTVPQS